jgi:hypothetical protein
MKFSSTWGLTNLRCEFLEFLSPVVKDTEWADDQKWLKRTLTVEGIEGDSLKCLANYEIRCSESE